MIKYSDKELKNILDEHRAWLINNEHGKRADLYGADLYGADLRGADLRFADLRFADLRGADLRGADLRGADLRGADLRFADLRGADLYGADLRGADLRNIDVSKFQIVPEVGSFIAFKKLKDNCIAELYVPRSAGRVGGLLGRKCRVEKVKVKAVYNAEGKSIELAETCDNANVKKTIYQVGKWVKPDSYNPDVRVECTNGIHIFITRKEAEEYT